MMAHCRCVKTGIDAAEKDSQAGCNNVTNCFSFGGEELFLSWLPRLDHDSNQLTSK